MNLYGMLSDSKALAGMLYGCNPKSIISYPAGAECDFGKGLFLEDGVVSNTKSDGTFVGVAVFHQVSFTNSRGSYPKNDTVASLNDGNIWVVLDSEVSPTDNASAYVKDDGTFTTESDGNTLVGKFKSVAENGLALVDISK